MWTGLRAVVTVAAAAYLAAQGIARPIRGPSKKVTALGAGASPSGWISPSG